MPIIIDAMLLSRENIIHIIFYIIVLLAMILIITDVLSGISSREDSSKLRTNKIIAVLGSLLLIAAFADAVLNDRTILMIGIESVLFSVLLFVILFIFYRTQSTAFILKRSKKRLESYILRCIKKGIDKDVIKSILLGAGWANFYIDEAFRNLIFMEITELIEKKGQKDVLIMYNLLAKKGYSKRDLNVAFDNLFEKHKKN